MRRRALIAIAFVSLALGLVAYKLIAPRSHILTLPRASNGTEYVLVVHVPRACRNGGCRALYVLDGLAWLPTFSEIHDRLTETGQIAPLVLVGVAHRDVLNMGDLRKRDFTPAFGRTPNRTGGADAFLTVLRDEIIPYAEAHLPISREERGLAGHSYAGLLAAYALAEAPDLFQYTLIMSPALWFDEGKIYDVAPHDASGPRAVFLAADTPRGQARSAMANDILRFGARLSTWPDLVVTHALIVGREHNSMVAPAARSGLIALYGETPP